MSLEQAVHTRQRDRGIRDDVAAYLETDPTWRTIPPDMQATVTISVNQVIRAPIAELKQMAEDLDSNEERNPYVARQEPLVHIYRGFFDYLERYGDWLTPESKFGILKTAFQVKMVERLIGSRVAEVYGWRRGRGFGINTGNATRAMDLGKQAVRRFAR